ncbi:MAG: replication protein P [Pseudohongiellaceae bacterium]
MEKINPLLDRANKELKSGSKRSQTEAGQTSSIIERGGASGPSREMVERVRETGPDYSQQNELDHVDAINQVFAEFEFAYHNQFHKAFSAPESLVIAKKYWLSSLESYSPAQIVHAAKRVISTQDFLPSIAAFIRACEEGLDLFGLPSTRQAYLEACAAPSPKVDYDWTHEAVYLAGKSSGWFLLASEPEQVALPLFQYHYELLCKRVLKGEELLIDQPTPIPEKVSRRLSTDEKKQRVAALKAELGL